MVRHGRKTHTLRLLGNVPQQCTCTAHKAMVNATGTLKEEQLTPSHIRELSDLPPSSCPPLRRRVLEFLAVSVRGISFFLNNVLHALLITYAGQTKLRNLTNNLPPLSQELQEMGEEILSNIGGTVEFQVSAPHLSYDAGSEVSGNRKACVRARDKRRHCVYQ